MSCRFPQIVGRDLTFTLGRHAVANREMSSRNDIAKNCRGNVELSLAYSVWLVVLEYRATADDKKPEARHEETVEVHDRLSA